MSSPDQQTMFDISVQKIGETFVGMYYQKLHDFPEIVFGFYKNESSIGRPKNEDSRSVTFASGIHAINAKIQSIGALKAVIESVDSQYSSNGGIIVFVTGHMVRKDGKRRDFIHTFFLAREEGDYRYYVLDDMLRYVGEGWRDSQLDINNLDDCVTKLNALYYEASAVQQNVISYQQEDVSGSDWDVYASVVNESDSKAEETLKKSYASVVKFMRDGIAPMPAPDLKSFSKKQHQ